jgi:hypothetical protein
VEERPRATSTEAVRPEPSDVDAVIAQHRLGDADELPQLHGGAEVRRCREALVLPLPQQWEAVHRDALRVERGGESADLVRPGGQLLRAVPELLPLEAGDECRGHGPERVGGYFQQPPEAEPRGLESGPEPGGGGVRRGEDCRLSPQ